MSCLFNDSDLGPTLPASGALALFCSLVGWWCGASQICFGPTPSKYTGYGLDGLGGLGGSKKMFTLLDLCVSPLRRDHANLLCIVPILTDVPLLGSSARRNTHSGQRQNHPRWGSNPQPPAPETDALPLRHAGLVEKVLVTLGLEPRTFALSERRSTD